MSDSTTTIQTLKEQIKNFVHARDWEQFHSPKNLSMSLSIEAAELMEHFQWLTEEKSRTIKTDKAKMTEINDEIADVALYLLALCNVLEVDLSKAIKKKSAQNAKKYPAKLVKGKMHKYTYYLKGKT